MSVTPPLPELLARAGAYAGHGIDCDDQPFHAELTLDGVLGRAVTLAYVATGIDGAPLHEERAWIAADERGLLCLWAVALDADGVVRHEQRHGAPPVGVHATLVFGRGEATAVAEDRAEVAIDLWPNGDLGYRRSRGRPGEAVRLRWTVRMRPLGATAAPAPERP